MSAAPRGDTPFPRLAAYLAQLPDGLDSFPDCRAKASIPRKVYEFAAQPLCGLDEPLQRLLDDPPPASSWIPQCHALALVVAMVEARGLGRLAESQWIRQAATHLFASPMYKVLMWAVSPRTVFKSANVRWSAFFRGTSLSSMVSDNSAVVTLDASTRLFHADLARIFVDVIYAAVNYTRDDAASATIALQRHDDGAIEYVGRW